MLSLGQTQTPPRLGIQERPPQGPRADALVLPRATPVGRARSAFGGGRQVRVARGCPCSPRSDCRNEKGPQEMITPTASPLRWGAEGTPHAQPWTSEPLPITAGRPGPRDPTQACWGRLAVHWLLPLRHSWGGRPRRPPGPPNVACGDPGSPGPPAVRWGLAAPPGVPPPAGWEPPVISGEHSQEVRPGRAQPGATLTGPRIKSRPPSAGPPGQLGAAWRDISGRCTGW